MSKTRKQSRAVQAKTIVHAENRSVGSSDVKFTSTVNNPTYIQGEQENISSPLDNKSTPDVAQGIGICSVVASPHINTVPKEQRVKNTKIENKGKKFKKQTFTRYSIDCSLMDKVIDLTDLVSN